MDSVFKSAVAALILAAGLAGSVVAGAFEDGMDAAERRLRDRNAALASTCRPRR